MTVPAAIKELEKSEIIKLLQGRYRLSYALTATPKNILLVFGLNEDDVKCEAYKISEALHETEGSSLSVKVSES